MPLPRVKIDRAERRSDTAPFIVTPSPYVSTSHTVTLSGEENVSFSSPCQAIHKTARHFLRPLSVQQERQNMPITA